MIFESNNSDKNGTSETDDMTEESSRSKNFAAEISLRQALKDDGNALDKREMHREVQYMYIQMEFCERSTLRYKFT